MEPAQFVFVLGACCVRVVVSRFSCRCWLVAVLSLCCRWFVVVLSYVVVCVYVRVVWYGVYRMYV